MRRVALLIVLLFLARNAWAQELAPSGPWKAERLRRGDTAVVRTLSGSVWGDKVRLVEEVRIGSKDGDGPDSFGIITASTLFPDGVIAVFDQSVPALRLFDPNGKHLRTLGRDGAGPGEYRNQSLGLAVDRNGILLMYDPRNARLNRWKEDGTVLPSWRVPTGLYTSQSLQVDTTGTVFIKVLMAQPEQGKPWRIGLVRLDATGTPLDTLAQPPIEGDVEAGGAFFSPQVFWLRSRSGETVTGFGGRYAITLAPRTGSATRIERASPQVQLASAERGNYQAVMDARSQNPMARTTTPPGPVPGSKPYFRELAVDLDARLWVRIHGKGQEYDPPPVPQRPGAPPPGPPIRWREPIVWDVYRRDGTYLGQVQLPWRTSFVEARGDQVWATQRGDDDEHYIVRYRILAAP